MNKVIEIEKLWFSFRKETILEDINIEIFENELLGLIGPNGAGKTTLIKLILGLIRPARGSIKVFGRKPEEAGEHIGYVPQYSFHDVFFPITVMDVVLSGTLSKKKILRRYTGKDKESAMSALERVGMHALASRQIGMLSGGQRQRVMLARALVSDPRLIIMDEPFSGIDICLEFGFYELINELKKSRTILIISHDVGVVSSFVDRIACLNKVLVCHDSKEEALKNLHKVYKCPVDVIAHGIPHRVLGEH